MLPIEVLVCEKVALSSRLQTILQMRRYVRSYAFCNSFWSLEFPLLSTSSSLELQLFHLVIENLSVKPISLRRVRWSQNYLTPSVSRQSESIATPPNTELGAYLREACLCKHVTGCLQDRWDRRSGLRAWQHMWTCVEYVDCEFFERSNDGMFRKACVNSRYVVNA